MKILGVKKRGSRLLLLNERVNLFFERFVVDIGIYDPFGDGMPEALRFDQTGAFGQTVRGVADEKLGYVGACVRYVIIASALAEIDLKDSEACVAGIEFDVEIREARVADGFQKAFDAKHQLLAIFRENGNVIADALGGVLLQKNVSETHHSDLGVLVRIRGEDIHPRIVAGDEVLDDQRVVIAGAEDRLGDRLCLLGSLGDIDLFHAVKRILPIADGAGGLQNDGVGKGELVELCDVLLRVQKNGFGIIQTVFLTHLVKRLLGDQLLCQLGIGSGTKIILREKRAVLDDEIGVGVRAADEDEKRVPVLFGKAFEQGEENVFGVEIFYLAEFYDPAVFRRAEIVSAEGMGRNSVRLVKGARNAVAVEIGAEKNGDELLIGHRDETTPFG